MQYEFNIGDEVITAFGECGVITDICKCSECEKRGFYEPKWRSEHGDTEYITAYQFKLDFRTFYKIGKYHFGNLQKGLIEHYISNYEETLSRLRHQLSVIEELERGDQNAGEE